LYSIYLSLYLLYEKHKNQCGMSVKNSSTFTKSMEIL
jgi:hypothetical protein